MTDVLEAKFAQMVKDAKCPEAFKEWLIKQQLLTIETYGRVAASEDKLDAKVDAIFISEGANLGISASPLVLLNCGPPAATHWLSARLVPRCREPPPCLIRV